VHPIERLRYVARARGVDAESLVVETASALRGMGLDPSELVVSCRRIVERHPACGPLWWLCARTLTAADPATALRAAVDEIGGDATARRLAEALPDDATVVVAGWAETVADGLIRRGDARVLVVDADHAGTALVRRLERSSVECDLVPAHAAALAVAGADVVMVEALALDAGVALVPIGSAVVAAAAALHGVPVSLAAGVGRSLPAAMMAAVRARTVDVAELADAEVETIPLSVVATVHRPAGRVAQSRVTADCELAPELLRPSPM